MPNTNELIIYHAKRAIEINNLLSAHMQDQSDIITDLMAEFEEHMEAIDELKRGKVSWVIIIYN